MNSRGRRGNLICLWENTIKQLFIVFPQRHIRFPLYLLSVNDLIPKFTLNPPIVVLGNVDLRMRVSYDTARALFYVDILTMFLENPLTSNYI